MRQLHSKRDSKQEAARRSSGASAVEMEARPLRNGLLAAKRERHTQRTMTLIIISSDSVHSITESSGSKHVAQQWIHLNIRVIGYSNPFVTYSTSQQVR